MKNKQSLYRLSKDLKHNGWSGGSPVPPHSAQDTPSPPKAAVSIKMKEETVSMIEEKRTVPGVNEPSYLPPVVTLPADVACREYLLMSTLKKQQFDKTYEIDKGIDRGTIFPDLDLPFLGEGGTGK